MLQSYTGNSALHEDALLNYRMPEAAHNDNLMNILLIEDDYNDALLTIKAINATKIPYNMDRITRGEDVLPYLKNCAQNQLPDVCFLDMGLPGADGFEILSMLTEAPSGIRAVPIAILTGWSHFNHFAKNYQLPILGYVSKPLKVNTVESILSKAMDFMQ